MVNLLFGLLGLLVGGGINMLADELPAREGPQWPRCIQCRYRYGPAGWLGLARLLRGQRRCPQCALAVRGRVLAVEIISALVFALLPAFIETPANLLFGALYVAIFILIIVTDLEHRLILHAVTVPGFLLALLGSAFISTSTPLWSVLGAAFGFGAFFFIYWLGNRAFGSGAMGFGDVMLSTMMGAMLGIPFILFALVIGIFMGGIISLALLITGRISRHSYIAYGPFLAAAGIIMVIWGPEIFAWYLG